jgi:hypothetical protein
MNGMDAIEHDSAGMSRRVLLGSCLEQASPRRGRPEPQMPASGFLHFTTEPTIRYRLQRYR